MEIEQARELRDALTRAIERLDNHERELSSPRYREEATKTRR
jgi:DNA-directed RNA polymerase specialized sigma subunit